MKKHPRNDSRTLSGDRTMTAVPETLRDGSAAPRIVLESRDPEAAVRPDLLDTFPYAYPGSPATVEISTEEFTAVCPWSGLPDQGTLTVRYVPMDRVIELRSFKYYLLSYRSAGIYQEHAANRILQDLVQASAPEWMELDLDYRIRGGVHTVVRVRWPHVEAP